MAASIDDILGEISPVERTVPVCTAGHLIAQREQLERDLSAAIRRDAEKRSIDARKEAPKVAEQIQEVEAEMEAKTRIFRVQAIAIHDWRALVAAHPPTDADREAGFDYNAETLPIAAVAACCVDPPMTPEKAGLLAGVLQPAQWTRLWLTTREANTGGDSLPKSVTATAVLRASEQNSTSPAGTAFPTPSSPAE